MEPDEQVVKKLSDLMYRACALLEEQARMIRAGADNTLEDATFRIFLERSIRVYVGSLKYLASEILRTDESIYPYLLPNVRTLLDVYARFLHLASLAGDEEKRALTCVIYHLQTMSGHMADSQYVPVYTLYRPMILKHKIPVPADPKRFDARKFEKMEISFPNRRKILTEEKIRAHSVHVAKNFGMKMVYGFYAFFSETLHGNPYTYAEGINNERLWIISLSLINSALFIELIDKYILHRGQSRDSREWFKDLLAERASLTEVWMSRRKVQGK